MPDFDIPQEFLNSMESRLGKNEFPAFLEALEKEPNTSIRINPFKPIEISFQMEKIPWSSQGYYLKERPSFTMDPLFHAGTYYVQESSSMFVEHILNAIDAPREGVFLDLAAAPGGKSTILSSYLGESGFLVANEVLKPRANILKENIIKWGLGNTLVTQNDPEHFRDLQGFFDLVLVDAPCSGEGMFRRDHHSRSEWSMDNVNLCAARQERILDIAGSLVKPDGYLIYSTCTFNEKENEEMIRFLVEEFAYSPVRIPLISDWNIVESKTETEEGIFYGYQFLPHLVQGEGFFVSVLKRKGEAVSTIPKKSKDFKHPFLNSINKTETERIKQDLSLPENSHLYQLQDSYFWINKKFQIHFEYLTHRLSIKYFGVELGKYNKDKFIPNHEWALSTLPKNVFPSVELSLEQALAYLRKDDLDNIDLPEGWILITFRKHPLGWIKNLGNRINNYYPKEWRVRNK
jgi:16S rRNA C967 or C1407 C5-methylase (RsmB/RsmF family)/NOL1/NOP2/fmu family ribosome biogenesis protein